MKLIKKLKLSILMMSIFSILIFVSAGVIFADMNGDGGGTGSSSTMAGGTTYTPGNWCTYSTSSMTMYKNEPSECPNNNMMMMYNMNMAGNMMSMSGVNVGCAILNPLPTLSSSPIPNKSIAENGGVADPPSNVSQVYPANPPVMTINSWYQVSR
ncbi:MAG: hypothetical protein M1502_03780 [Deltaproteobacteria bacterium]|nr:hypothetical protein [Deltaproteobacteria bacterium]